MCVRKSNLLELCVPEHYLAQQHVGC